MKRLTLHTWLSFNSIFLILHVSLLYAQPEYPVIPAHYKDVDSIREYLSNHDIDQRSEWQYIIINGVVTSQKYKAEEIHYDKKGRIEEKIKINKKGLTETITVFNYHKNGLLNTITEFIPRGELNWQRKFNYSEKAFLTEVISQDLQGFIIEKEVYKIDTLINLITLLRYISPENLKETQLYYYENLKNGKLLETMLLKNNDIQVFWKTYRYTQSRLTEVDVQEGDVELEYKLKYLYSPNGQLKEIIRVYNDGSELKNFIYNYNEIGLLSGEIRYDNDGRIKAYIKYTYN